MANNLMKTFHLNNKRIENEIKISHLLVLQELKNLREDKGTFTYLFGGLNWHNFLKNGKLIIIINLKCVSFD